MQINFSLQVKQPNHIDKQQVNPCQVSFSGVKDSFERTTTPQQNLKKLAHMFFQKFMNYELGLADQQEFKKHDDKGIKLRELARNYRKTLSLPDKKALLYHEEDMLWQELENPEIGVVRNSMDLKHINVRPSDSLAVIKLSALLGLIRTYDAYNSLGIVSCSDKEEKFKIIKDIMYNAPDNSQYASQIKEKAFDIAFDVAPDNKQLCEFLDYVSKNETNEEIKNRAIYFLNIRKPNEPELITLIYDNNSTSAQKKSAIESLGRE